MRCPYGWLCVVLALACGACTRYEWVSSEKLPECRERANTAPPSFAPLLVQRDDSLPAGTIVGRVTSTAAPSGLAQTPVEIRGSIRRSGATDSFGRFRFDSIATGKFELVVRRLGFQVARDSIVAHEDAGLRVETRIEAVPIVFDESCSSLVQIQMPKPWWKFW